MTDLERIRAEAHTAEREDLMESLRRSGGKIAAAARVFGCLRADRLGLGLQDAEDDFSRPAFYRLMDKHGITRPRKA